MKEPKLELRERAPLHEPIGENAGCARRPRRTNVDEGEAAEAPDNDPRAPAEELATPPEGNARYDDESPDAPTHHPSTVRQGPNGEA